MAFKRVDTAELFDIEYPRCRSWLIEALALTGEFTERQVLEGIADGDFSLFTNDHSVAVIQLTKFQNQSACLLVLVAGEKGKALREIMTDGMNPMIDWAMSKSCTCIIGTPRKEWDRLLRRNGFKVQEKYYYKEF